MFKPYSVNPKANNTLHCCPGGAAGLTLTVADPFTVNHVI